MTMQDDGGLLPIPWVDQDREDNAQAAPQATPAQLARGILQLADLAGMPDSFWLDDSRVRMARGVLGVPDDGRYTHAHLWETPPSDGQPKPAS